MAAKAVRVDDEGEPGPATRLLERNPTLTAYRISYLANFYSGPVYRSIEREHGLLRPEFMVLFCLAEHGPTTSAEICRATGLPKNSVSRAVARLLVSGAVARAPHPGDGRAVCLEMTRDGTALYRRIIPRFVARERELLSVLSAGERATLDGLLSRLVHRRDGWAEME